MPQDLTKVDTPSPYTGPSALNFGAPALAGAGALAVPAPTALVAIKPPSLTEDDITNIGADAAKSLSGVSHQLLSQIRSSDAGDFGKGLSELVGLARGLDPEALKSKGFISRILGAASSAKSQLMAKYATVEKQMDELAVQLDGKAVHHQRRIGEMESLYADNYAYHQQLEAGVAHCEGLLRQVNADYDREKIKPIGDSFGAQILGDYQRLIARIEKRIDDLKRAMLLSKQTAPQIRIMQDDARALVLKFGDVKALTLPAWKNTFTLYVLQMEQKQSVALLDSIDETTNEALRKSADLLRQNSAAIAESRNRSLVSVDTLMHVQTQLLGAITDVKRIDEEGRARRLAEAPKLLEMEQELIRTFAPGQR